MDEGIKINLVSQRKLNEYSSDGKINFVLHHVKNGTVLVLERGLTAEEEIQLIRKTMLAIDHDTFIGIEIESYGDGDIKKNWIKRLINRTVKTAKMTVIGPANFLKTIHKDDKIIQAMILTNKGIVGEV